jgi:hypothetical protein
MPPLYPVVAPTSGGMASNVWGGKTESGPHASRSATRAKLLITDGGRGPVGASNLTHSEAGAPFLPDLAEHRLEMLSHV